ncbi:unnamed protein product [Prunus armeniaca]
MEGTFGRSSLGLCRRATTKPLIGLNGKSWILVFALLTSNHPIDQLSKEPHLGLGSFNSLGSRMIDITLFDCFPWMDLVTCMKTSGDFGPTSAGRAWTSEDFGFTSSETMWLLESLILIEHNPPMLDDLECQ